MQPGDRLGAILISIDLSILGAEPARYDAYAAAIRQEFIHVGDADYRAGRGRVLRHFAARPVIFPDAGFAAAYDGRARDNLARSWRRSTEAATRPIPSRISVPAP